MTTLTDQIDRFVRWFFNCSPEATLIEPLPLPTAHHRRRNEARHVEHERRRVQRSQRSTGADGRNSRASA